MMEIADLAINGSYLAYLYVVLLEISILYLQRPDLNRRLRENDQTPSALPDFYPGNIPNISEIVPLIIVTKLEQYDYAGATAIACVMLGASFILLFIINWLQKWTGSHAAVH